MCLPTRTPSHSIAPESTGEAGRHRQRRTNTLAQTRRPPGDSLDTEPARAWVHDDSADVPTPFSSRGPARPRARLARLSAWQGRAALGVARPVLRHPALGSARPRFQPAHSPVLPAVLLSLPFPSFARSPPCGGVWAGARQTYQRAIPGQGVQGVLGVRASLGIWRADTPARALTPTRTHAHTHAPRKRPRPPTHLKKVAIIVLRKEGRPQTAQGGQKQAEPAETNKHSWERETLPRGRLLAAVFSNLVCALDLHVLGTTLYNQHSSVLFWPLFSVFTAPSPYFPWEPLAFVRLCIYI